MATQQRDCLFGAVTELFFIIWEETLDLLTFFPPIFTSVQLFLLQFPNNTDFKGLFIQLCSSADTSFQSSRSFNQCQIHICLCKCKTSRKPFNCNNNTEYNIFLSIFLSWSCIHNEAGHYIKCTFLTNFNYIWTSRTESQNRTHVSRLLQTNCRAHQNQSSIKKEQLIFTVQKLAQYFLASGVDLSRLVAGETADL